MRRSILRFALTLLVVSSACASPSALADDAAERATLKGLDEVRLVISEFGREAEAQGLKRQEWQSHLEGRLKAAGIKLLAASERARGMPTLFLNLNLAAADPGENSEFVYSLELSLIQEVRLVRAQNIRVQAPTWKGAGSIGIVESDMLDSLREMSTQAIDSFIAAYRAANAIK